jgi:hypothetical protein
MPQFILKIDLGNEVMQTPFDIRCAIDGVSKKIQFGDNNPGDQYPILNINGNKVGYYEVTE